MSALLMRQYLTVMLLMCDQLVNLQTIAAWSYLKWE